MSLFKRKSTFGAMLALVLAASAAPGQTYRYDVTVLDPLPGHSSLSARAINNAGQVIGVSYGSPINNQTPVIYSPGAGVQPLPQPPGYAYSVPYDINDQGVIVGYAQTTWSDEMNPVAWKLAGGAFTMLPLRTYANGVNNLGTVVGRACLSGTSLTCFFEHGAAGFATFGTTSGYASTGWRFIDINDAEQMALGHYTAALERREADGSLTPLPSAPPPYVRAFIWAINEPGQIIGRYEYNVGTQYYSRAFRWTQGVGAEIIGITNYHVRPKGLNNLGQVVGESGGNENSYLDMWLWTPERGNEDIEPLIEPTLQIVVTGVAGINDAGQIIGRGVRQLPPVTDVTFLLTPVTTIVPGDIDGDGDVDSFDCDLFVAVLLGIDTDSDHVTRADLNGDGAADGADCQPFVAAMVEG